MIRRPPRSTRVRSSAASDVYKRQTLNVVGIGFRKGDDKFREAFNAALAKVMAKPATMLKRAGEYGYDKAQLPPPEMSTAWACSTK